MPVSADTLEKFAAERSTPPVKDPVYRDEVLAADVSFDVPPPVTYDLDKSTPYICQYLSPFFTSEEAFLTEYPPTTYTLGVDRGAGPETGDVYLEADMYCAEIPTLTGDTYDRLQSCAASEAFHATINGFTPAAGTNQASISVVLVEAGVGGVFSVSLSPSDTEFEIPAQLILLALGFSGPERRLAEQFGIGVDARGNFSRDESFATSVPGVFVAGDAGRGQSLIVWAIAEGRGAAAAVDRFLSGLDRLPVAVTPATRPLTA